MKMILQVAKLLFPFDGNQSLHLDIFQKVQNCPNESKIDQDKLLAMQYFTELVKCGNGNMFE